MMRRPGPVVLMALVMACAVGPVAASVIVSVNNVGSSTLHEVSVLPGGAFSVDLNVSEGLPLNEIWADLAASQSGIFDVIGGTFQSPWGGAGAQLPLGGIDSVLAGFYGSPGFPDTVEASYPTMATLNMSVAPSAPLGTYAINVSNVKWHDCWTCLTVPYDGQAGSDLVVHVIPEPAGLAVVLIGGIMGLRRRVGG